MAIPDSLPPVSVPRLFGAGGPAASATPYNAPAYFPPAYFPDGAAGGDATGPTPGRTPYNAPTYFPPAYFYGGAADTDAAPPASGRTPYNAPTYFPPAYFYGGAADTTSTPATPPAIPGGRDGASYAALVALLEASGRFNSVAFGDPSRAGDGGAADHPRAIVTPTGWAESDDADPVLATRRSLFAIRLTIRDDDVAYPFDELDRLSAEVQARVDGSSLGGRCVPALTKIRAGSYQTTSRYPEWSVDLDGEFTTLVDPTAP